ncbi:hypothetical protein MP228_010452 [Amoeboaphelidium protococcarum]|nr:hypothetical protein MP228_010452 [Amoeboaphelidium protococcarum]
MLVYYLILTCLYPTLSYAILVELISYKMTARETFEEGKQAWKEGRTSEWMMSVGSLACRPCLGTMRYVGIPLFHPAVAVHFEHDQSTAESESQLQQSQSSNEYVIDYNYVLLGWSVTPANRQWRTETYAKCDSSKSREDINYFIQEYEKYLDYGTLRNNCQHGALHLLAFLCDDRWTVGNLKIFLQELVAGNEKQILDFSLEPDTGSLKDALPKKMTRLPKFLYNCWKPGRLMLPKKPGFLRRRKLQKALGYAQDPNGPRVQHN